MSDVPAPKRKITIETTAHIKVNTGNFETIDVSKTLRAEVEYANAEELLKKSQSMDAICTKMAKIEAELVLKETGRQRVIKPNAQEKEADIWNGPPAVPALAE